MMSLSRGAPYLWDIFEARELGFPFLLVTEAGTASTPLALRADAIITNQARLRDPAILKVLELLLLGVSTDCAE